MHADALAVLDAWAAPSPAQEALRVRYVEHLRAHPDGVRRECRPDHLTASTLVLSADRSRVLLTLHAKARRWFQLGGHCEDTDATLGGAALREASEESGLDGLVLTAAPVHLDEHVVPFCGRADAPGGPVHHLDVRFVAVAPADAVHTISEESLDLRWWPVDALPDPELADLVEHALATPLPVAQSTSGGPTSVAADQPSR
nr:NUDIX hydrolase [Nocardioides sp. zg-DK7169]